MALSRSGSSSRRAGLGWTVRYFASHSLQHLTGAETARLAVARGDILKHYVLSPTRQLAAVPFPFDVRVAVKCAGGLGETIGAGVRVRVRWG